MTKRVVWVRAAGRCIICTRSLLTTHLGDRAEIRSIGEVAHIAGESTSGPRGRSSVKPTERNDVSNLILLCPTGHTTADTGRLIDPLYTEEYLLRHKERKEAWIDFVTGLDAERTTIVLRLAGDVRGHTDLVQRVAAAQATMDHALRTPQYLPDPRGVGLTINLQGLPSPGSPKYWVEAVRQITAEVDRVREASRNGEVSHVSVFAFGLLPLLVALGSLLDDTVPCDIYERHRSSDSWMWNREAEAINFGHQTPAQIASETAVLIINASGSIDPGELPADLAELPILVIEPSNGDVPGTTTFESSATLASFTSAARGLLAALEQQKHVRHLHVFAAAPVSAAVSFGRIWPVDNAAPNATIYHRTDQSYVPALRIPTRLTNSPNGDPR